MNAELIETIIAGFIGLCAVVGILWATAEFIFKKR